MRRRTAPAALALLAAGLGLAAAAPTGTAAAAPAGYPTEVLADYVFGCMGTNGQTPDALRRCACSIDHIATKLTYDEYAQAETVLRMRQIPGGGRVGMFRSSPWAADMVDKLRLAQVEAEAKCF